MSDIHLPVFCLLGGGQGRWEDSRLRERERETEREREIMYQYIVYTCTVEYR